jgi:hydrogenase-4 component F
LAAPVIGAIPATVVALPFVTAALLAVVASWRIGTWINAGSASLQFVVACALVAHAGAAKTHLVMLTAFVAMTTSWFGWRDITAAIAARSLSRRSARLYHAGNQALVGAVQAAALADSPMVAWLALVVAVAAAAAMTGAARGPDAAAAASRLVLYCAIGLLLALLGTVLLDLASGPAGVFVLLGYGALAGLVPLHSWLANAMAEAVAPGAITVTLLANVPLLLFMRLQIDPAFLIAFGLASLLLGAIAISARLDRRRTVALAGMAQFGMMVFAIGIGAKQVAWLHMTLLALARSAVLQSRGDGVVAWLALALLPLYALYLLAEPTVAVSAWLLVPLAVGVLLTVWALLERRPAGIAADRLAAAPIWLPLALMVLLAFAMPGQVVAWFRVAAAP